MEVTASIIYGLNLARSGKPFPAAEPLVSGDIDHADHDERPGQDRGVQPILVGKRRLHSDIAGIPPVPITSVFRKR